MSNFLWIVIFSALAFILGASYGYEIRGRAIKKECDRHGAFYIGDERYDCKKVGDEK